MSVSSQMAIVQDRRNMTAEPTKKRSNARQYFLRLVNIRELFRMRDAMDILKEYDMHDPQAYADVYAEIERRTQ